MPDNHVETPMHGYTLTVGGLIKVLQGYPSHWPVITEGCDCYGSAFQVSAESSGKEPFLLIEREPISKPSHKTTPDIEPHKDLL